MSLAKLRVLSAQLQVHYDEMAATFSSYQLQSGLQCLSGCGACCLQSTIEASPFEMLPIALSLFDQGLAEETLGKLQQHQDLSCFFYQALNLDGSKGLCSIYAQRPTLCRVFGAGALPDKKLGLKLSLCRLIKQAHGENMPALNAEIAPRIDHWKQKSGLLCDDFSNQDLPINQALKMALEKVTMLGYYESLQADRAEGQQVG